MDASPPGAAWEGIDMSPFFWPLFWGTALSLILSGIIIQQAWIYFPSKDVPLVRLTAVLMLVLDVASTVLVVHGVYQYLVPHFGSLLPLAFVTPALAAECFLSVFITLISHLYFGWQAYHVIAPGPAKLIVPGLVVMFASISFGGGLACATALFIRAHRIFTNRSLLFVIVMGVAKGAAGMADIVATTALCASLMRSMTGMKHTDSLLRRITQQFIERGVLVTAVQLLLLLIFFLAPARNYWLPLHFNLTRLYTSTFFAMLNGRKHLRPHDQHNTTTLSVFGHGASHTGGGATAVTPTTPAFGRPFSHSDDESIFDGLTVHKSVEVADI